jgi:hypothetical protein
MALVRPTHLDYCRALHAAAKRIALGQATVEAEMPDLAGIAASVFRGMEDRDELASMVRRALDAKVEYVATYVTKSAKA